MTGTLKVLTLCSKVSSTMVNDAIVLEDIINNLIVGDPDIEMLDSAQRFAIDIIYRNNILITELKKIRDSE